MERYPQHAFDKSPPHQRALSFIVTSQFTSLSSFNPSIKFQRRLAGCKVGRPYCNLLSGSVCKPSRPAGNESVSINPINRSGNGPEFSGIRAVHFISICCDECRETVVEINGTVRVGRTGTVTLNIYASAELSSVAHTYNANCWGRSASPRKIRSPCRPDNPHFHGCAFA